MHDHLGGGFHRYSVDERWFVPHFEKMLYDQAQLAVSYVEAFQITGDTSLAETARRILLYVLRDLRDPEGGFYSAEDADSAADPAQPALKSEGAFYLWTASEIEATAGNAAAKWFCHRYGVRQSGNVDQDPHGEFTGKSILFEAHTLEETARHFERTLSEVQSGVSRAEEALLAARRQRPRPHLDDKVLAAWNGLILSALAKAAAVLDDQVFLDAARDGAAFIAARLWDPASGTLLRRWRKGEAAIPGFLDDYAFVAQGLLDLYEADFDVVHLQLALRLTERAIELFADAEHGGFFNTAAGDPSLLLRMKEDYDGAEPSGNSVMALNLFRLAQMAGREGYRAQAESTLAAFGSRLSSVPAAVPQMMVALAFSLGKPAQVVLVGDPNAPEMRELTRVVQSRFLPGHVVLQVNKGTSRDVLGAFQPAIRTMGLLEGKAAAYVCENFACRLPVSDAKELAGMLG
jgi:uncharacterized protein YyaL (SSP411 family)